MDPNDPKYVKLCKIRMVLMDRIWNLSRDMVYDKEFVLHDNIRMRVKNDGFVCGNSIYFFSRDPDTCEIKDYFGDSYGICLLEVSSLPEVIRYLEELRRMYDDTEVEVFSKYDDEGKPLPEEKE